MAKKFLVLLIDGMADYPLEQLGGKTILEAADTPALEGITASSEVGTLKTVPEGYAPGSDVANMSVMGYDPACYYTGRSPFEALSMGVELDSEEVSLRCNLVTLSQETEYENKVMEDYSAGEISSEEAAELITSCQENLGNEKFKFYSGVSYRHLLVWKGGNPEIELTPPHDISDQKIGAYLPQGSGNTELLDLMKRSTEFLPEHEVNQRRRNDGLAPANSIWLWGEGTRPKLDSFAEKYGLSGSVISAVDLIKGLGIAAGLKIVDVPGATGRIDTNFSGKAEAAVDCLQSGDDFVYLHVEAADEAGHQGEIDTKIKAVEKVDHLVLKYILQEIGSTEELSLLVLPDHYTPISLKTHVSEPVPFLLYRNYQPGKKEFRVDQFSEKKAAQTNFHLEDGYKLMDYFVG
ncbi:MAG: cofactor-independent phosphoglycerate mutase [Halanaerobiaceae bacterium]